MSEIATEASLDHAGVGIWLFSAVDRNEFIMFFNYGLAVRLGLLSTPFLDDSVTSGYGHSMLCPKRTFTFLLRRAFRRTLKTSPACHWYFRY